MTTLSVPLPANLENFIQDMVESGRAANKTDVVRKALIQMKEDEAVNAVLQAEKEPTLHGDLTELAKNI